MDWFLHDRDSVMKELIGTVNHYCLANLLKMGSIVKIILIFRMLKAKFLKQEKVENLPQWPAIPPRNRDEIISPRNYLIFT